MKNILCFLYCVYAAIGMAQPDTLKCAGICYTDRQDINCLECLSNAPKRMAQITELQSKSNDQASYIDDLKSERDKLRIKNQQLQSNLDAEKRKKRMWRFATATACGVVFIETLLFFIK